MYSKKRMRSQPIVRNSKKNSSDYFSSQYSTIKNHISISLSQTLKTMELEQRAQRRILSAEHINNVRSIARLHRLKRKIGL